ncbi:hypothetical protein SAMD00023378_3927 [Ralstonia sp. NT80]|uniref:hypothetical protein n=1 Tax=Ralstonia sp. NT80 TaxID=1218247 RepID=UPI00076EAC1D|nr:hypothetical protein [Ralstonia sp. NT80]GAQ30244.1 hypothetical protein SAMD00023378_3927 [Ralstonia sp. NT80]
MTTTEIYVWAAVALALLAAFIGGFLLLVTHLAHGPKGAPQQEEADQRAQKRRY